MDSSSCLISLYPRVRVLMCSRALIALGGFDSLHGLKMELQRFRRNPEDFGSCGSCCWPDSGARDAARDASALQGEPASGSELKGVDLDDMLLRSRGSTRWRRCRRSARVVRLWKSRSRWIGFFKRPWAKRRVP